MTEEALDTKPPYLPWTTFDNITDTLRAKGLPPQLDKTAIQGKSGGIQTQYLAALEFFGLIDENKAPTDRFKTYVANPEARPDLMRELLEEKYPTVKALDKNATAKQLTDAIRDLGVEGDTARKAQAFYLNAAKFAGMQLSNHFPKTRPYTRRSTGGATRKRGRRSTSTQRNGDENDQVTPQSKDAKSRYIDLLLKKAEEDLDPELLNRIERVIGIPPESEEDGEELS
jgi:hypothetical protein